MYIEAIIIYYYDKYCKYIKKIMKALFEAMLLYKHQLLYDTYYYDKYGKYIKNIYIYKLYKQIFFFYLLSEYWKFNLEKTCLITKNSILKSWNCLENTEKKELNSGEATLYFPLVAYKLIKKNLCTKIFEVDIRKKVNVFILKISSRKRIHKQDKTWSFNIFLWKVIFKH